MRTYGRITNPITGVKTWVEVSTDAAGFDDYVWVTTLIQVLKLNLAESPFYADWGIPAKAAVVQQVFPDFYMTLTQQRFAGKFASLTLAKVALPTPTYNMNVTTNQGVKVAASIPA